MRKMIALILAALILLSGIPAVYAVDDSRDFFFELSVDGAAEKEVKPGDIITVAFTLHRSDSAEDYEMYAMQNEIRYDSNFFRLVEGSAMLSEGISTTEIGLRDHFREFYMNFVSLLGGEVWPSRRLIGSIQLEVIGTSGVSKITNEDYLVSTADGMDTYRATCQDVTVIVSSECTVSFETNGGTRIPDVNVPYGETIARPEDPVREGFILAGWYADIDLQTPWNFGADTVQGNMTLYARWEQDTPGADEMPDGLWLILGLLALLGLLIVLLILLMGRKTVRFETGCKAFVKDQKVRKGGLAQRPAEPMREGRTFAGWFFDQEYTERWDFENDKVERDMTLYAKWL